jgi:lactate dehydrogenase-like 2-hydroxyacid dehydrogenase
MKHRVLQYGRLMPMLERQLAETFDWHRLVDEADPKAWLQERGREFVGLATAGFADAALIEALPSLKVISSFGVGVDKIDLAAAGKRGIPVGNTPDVLNDCVADLALGLMIDVSRGMVVKMRLGEALDRNCHCLDHGQRTALHLFHFSLQAIRGPETGSIGQEYRCKRQAGR